jgi:hypothetical protein
MKTAFVANMPVATLDVKELLGDEFRRQHQDYGLEWQWRLGGTTGPWRSSTRSRSPRLSSRGFVPSDLRRPRADFGAL